VCITCDSAKLDAYCCHIIGGFKFSDKDSRNPLITNDNDILKSGMPLFNKTQSENNCYTSITVIAKDTKVSYTHSLGALFSCARSLRDIGIPELGWKKKKFKMVEPHDMKSSQLCMHRGGAAKVEFFLFFIYAKGTATT
jgi:hypothetical protein